MAEKIVLNKAEKKLKERVTVAGAKSSVQTLGWCMAIWPVFLTVLTLVEMMFGFELPPVVWMAIGMCCMFWVLCDVRYMRTFFGANFNTGAWTAGSFFLGGAVNCTYLFVRRKHIKDNKLRGIVHAQAETGLICWIVFGFIVTISAIMTAIAEYQSAAVAM